MKRILLSILGLTLASTGAISQVDPCGTNMMYEEFRKANPELATELPTLDEVFENKPRRSETHNTAKLAPYRIPVVVHVLHMYGAENVSDSYVYALIDQLTEDFNAANPELASVHPDFQALIGNAQVEFVLASKDPLGECTNGIEHIYTHESFSGDYQGSIYNAAHKVGQWDRSRYFNIWLMGTLNGTAGLLGYGTFPSMTTGSGFFIDGVAVRYDNSIAGRTMTHEVGHWLGLCHTFGCAGTAGDGICQGDDNCDDTPETDGTWGCNVNEDSCNPGIVENVQNFMDYSNCEIMFTLDQVDIMQGSLEDMATAQRQNLWQDSTLISTGVKDLVLPQVPSNDTLNLTVPLCAPVADFFTSDRTVCVGSPVSLKDWSWNAVVADRLWEFEGGTPATATSPNVDVTWDTPGFKQVKLTVSNDAGSDTRTETQYIYVSPDWPDFTGPTSWNMDDNQGYSNWFLVQNHEDNYGKFMSANTNSSQGKAFKLQTYKDVSQADAWTDDFWYNARLGGSVDELITPSVDLRNTTGITVSFKFAYATNATLQADITELLKVYTSRDCGETWQTKSVSIDFGPAMTSITGANLVTAGYAGQQDFTPSNNGQWKTGRFSYVPNSSDNKMRIKFEFTASDLASNLWIDDIMIDGTLGLNDATIADLELVVFPNPTAGEAINVSYNAGNEPTEFILRDVQGKIIAQEVINTTNTQVTQTLMGTENLAASYYFLEVKTGGSSITKKVVVL